MKFAHWISWYVAFQRPAFGLYASVIFLSVGLNSVPPQGMFQNLIALSEPPAAPPEPPLEHAASAAVAATLPAIPRKPRLEKEDPVDCEAMTVSFPAAVA